MKKLWDNTFGTAWDKLSQSVPDISAFIIDHSTKSVITDSNASVILGFSRSPGYEELSLLAEGSVERSMLGRDFRFVIVRDDENVTAGFIHRVNAAYDIYSELPVCSFTEFASAASSADSSIALIRLGRVDSPEELPEAEMSGSVVALYNGLPEGSLISPAEGRRFWLCVPTKDQSLEEVLRSAQTAVKSVCMGVTFSAGCGAENGTTQHRMRTAEVTLLDALQVGNGKIELYSDERYEQRKSEYENMRRLIKLIDENLFIYHFQPIVSTETGDIVAYEALMRTDKSINMVPLEILSAASKLCRLYDIEKATVYNTLDFISKNQSTFKQKKLFINSIPAHMLSQKDWDAVVQEYGELMEKLVIEMTEQTEIDDERLATIHDRLERSNIRIAIDDYGTGYSNTSNLLRYRPKCVKIDRTLVEGIDRKIKAQKLIMVLIEFCHENGFEVFAEGIETRNELKTMIKLGADFVQGYYISRPKPFTIDEVSEELKKEILSFGSMYSGNSFKVYKPKNGERVDLEKLALEKYSNIFVDVEKITVKGVKDRKNHITITVEDGVSTDITLCNASLINDKISPCIALGENSSVCLRAEGDNECMGKQGIFVPATSSVHICGSGVLSVISEEIIGYGIGTDKDHNAGNITIDGGIKLNVRANGEHTVGIGGGKNEAGTKIRILGGNVGVRCSGGNCIGIGVFDGGACVELKECFVAVDISSPYAVAVGTVTGSEDIRIKDSRLECTMSGENLRGIGALREGSGLVSIESGAVFCDMHGNEVNCIGTRGGSLDFSISCANTRFDCEGSHVVGIGDPDGVCNASFENVELNMNFSVKTGIGICTGSGTVCKHNCRENIHINE